MGRKTKLEKYGINVGMVLPHMTILDIYRDPNGRGTKVRFQCECGAVVDGVQKYKIIYGKVRSCGCSDKKYNAVLPKEPKPRKRKELSGLAQDAKRAIELGMSYGKYKAMEALNVRT